MESGPAKRSRLPVTFRVLGPVAAQVDGKAVDLGGAKRRGLVADLLVNAGELVSVERLVRDLWGDEPPATARKMVQILVSQLRRSLGAASPMLLTQHGGYRMTVERDQLDLLRFKDFSAAGEALMASEPALAAAELRRALACWSGPALANISEEPFAAASISSLEEQRLTVWEHRLEADLRLGHGADLVVELQELTSRHPYRERFHSQLMLALYRAGRQAEALEHYRSVWSRLAEELGVQPTTELSAMNAAILRQDDHLLVSPERVRAGVPGAVEANPRHQPIAVQAGSTPHDQAETTPARPRSRRRRWLRRGSATVAAGAVGLAAVVGLEYAGHGHVGTSPRVVANSVVSVDSDAGRVVAVARVGLSPGPVAVGDGSVWVGNTGDKTLARLDADDLATQRIFGLTYPATSLTFQPGSVWIGGGYSGTLSRILTAYNELTQPSFPGSQAGGLLAVAVDRGSLWVGTADNHLLRLDQQSLRMQLNLAMPGHVDGVAVGDGEVWTIEFRDRLVREFDSDAGRPQLSVTVPGKPEFICVEGPSLWVATNGDVLWRLSATTGSITGTRELGFPPAALACSSDGIWISSGLTGRLVRVDPATTKLTKTLSLHHPIGGIALGDGRLWLAVD